MAQRGLYVGLDIGGTKLMAATAAADGRILKRTQQPTPLDLEEGLAALHVMIHHVAGEDPVLGIGAAIGGPLDWRTGIVSPLHQPQWREVPLKRIMEERWACPFCVDVDTNIAAVGEYRSSGASVGRFLYITISTGMGGGFLVDGKIYRGAGGGHPEIAHQSIPFRCGNPDAVACECGAPDCLEALVSGNGIRRIYGCPAEELTPQQWEEVAYHLGQGLRNMAAMYVPDVIVLGGGVALGGGRRLLDAARTVMASHLRIVPCPQLRLTSLGPDTALVGALVIAREGLA